MCAVVAERGLHDASMATVAKAAGVATGTAYVHYSSKEELLFATYLEVKQALGAAAVAGVDPDAPADERFRQLWMGAFEHLVAHPEHARFLVQLEGSPLAAEAHGRAMAIEDDPMQQVAATPDLADRLVDLPALVLYDLALGPAVRLAASGTWLDPDGRAALRDSCWRAITVASR
jgi:TetR/AcrR family transcriptional repressor of multidrug resistance operon